MLIRHNWLLKALVAVALIVLVAVPATTSAAGWVNLIPCDGTDADPCEFDDLIQLFKNVITDLVILSVPLAAIGFAYAGFLYITAGGGSGVGRAHKIFRNVAIGFAWVLAAWLVVNAITTALLKDDFNPIK